MHRAPGALDVRLGEEGGLALIPSSHLFVGGTAIGHCGGVVGEKRKSMTLPKPIIRIKAETNKS